MCKVCDERKLELQHDLNEAQKDLTTRVEQVVTMVNMLSQKYVNAGRLSAAVTMGLSSLPTPREENDPNLLYEIARKSFHYLNEADELVRQVVDASTAARDMGLHIKGMEMMKMLMDQMPEHEHKETGKKPTLH